MKPRAVAVRLLPGAVAFVCMLTYIWVTSVDQLGWMLLIGAVGCGVTVAAMRFYRRRRATPGS